MKTEGEDVAEHEATMKSDKDKTPFFSFSFLFFSFLSVDALLVILELYCHVESCSDVLCCVVILSVLPSFPFSSFSFSIFFLFLSSFLNVEGSLGR